MNEIKLEIKDYYVLLNLHKALLEAKFHENPDNILVSSSPIIANLCDEIIEILEKIDEKRGKNSAEWEEWRKLGNQSYYKQRAIKNATLNMRWLELSEQEKVETSKQIMSPFKATEDEIIEFIKEVDERIVGR